MFLIFIFHLQQKVKMTNELAFFILRVLLKNKNWKMDILFYFSSGVENEKWMSNFFFNFSFIWKITGIA